MALSDVPSMGTTAPLASCAFEETQATKHVSTSTGSSSENTWLNMSCEGMPPGSDKKLPSHSRLASP